MNGVIIPIDTKATCNKLETKLWSIPQEFNAAMQDEAFAWLNTQLKQDANAPEQA